MPYIKPEDRELVSVVIGPKFMVPANPGQLNFQITELLTCYLSRKGTNYQTINDISGAMTECLAEFRRRVVVPYENAKMAENGDCYS